MSLAAATLAAAPVSKEAPFIVPLGLPNTDTALITDQPLLGQRFPFDFKLERVVLTLGTAPTGSTFIVDIKRNGASIFSTLLSVDAGEKTSLTASVPCVLAQNPTIFLAGDLLTFSITQIGATVRGQYPVVLLSGKRLEEIGLRVEPATDFVFRVKTDNAGTSNSTSFTLPVTGSGYNYQVDWGDGVVETIANNTSPTHDYGTAGTYTIRIKGIFPRIRFNNGGDRLKVVEVIRIGNVFWSLFTEAFTGCSNAIGIQQGGSCAQVTAFNQAFNGCAFTSFPLLGVRDATTFNACWANCTTLITFPSSFFDNWVASPNGACFLNTWTNCTSLTAQSVENILVSINNSGRTAPTGIGVNDKVITISYNVATGGLTPATTAAIASLKAKNWRPFINGVEQ